MAGVATEQKVDVVCTLAGCTWAGLQDTDLRQAHKVAAQHVEHTGHETHVVITRREVYGGQV